MTVLVFTFVLLLGNVIKEILESDHPAARPPSAWPACHSAADSLRTGFLAAHGMFTAALLVFGRFSADQELTAARASGISLISLVTPVLVTERGGQRACARGSISTSRPPAAWPTWSCCVTPASERLPSCSRATLILSLANTTPFTPERFMPMARTWTLAQPIQAINILSWTLAPASCIMKSLRKPAQQPVPRS